MTASASGSQKDAPPPSTPAEADGFRRVPSWQRAIRGRRSAAGGTLLVGAAGGGSMVVTNYSGVHGVTSGVLSAIAMLLTAALSVHAAWHERVVAREEREHDETQSVHAAEFELALEELRLRRAADSRWLESELELALAHVDRDVVLNLAELERQDRSGQMELFRLAVDGSCGRQVESLRATAEEISAVMPATQRMRPEKRQDQAPGWD